VLPAKGVLEAANRWLSVLERSELPQAAAVIRTDPRFADLTQTQYAAALDWLVGTGLLEDGPTGFVLTAIARGLSGQELAALFFGRSLETAKPPWLEDADLLASDPAFLPSDALTLAESLGLDENRAALVIRQVHGRIDLARRAEVGLAGEHALVELLEHEWPGCTDHVSLKDDGLGYDIVLSIQGVTWHIEVKSTTRRGRLVLHISRQEFEVGHIDPDWRLVVLGLDSEYRLACIATVETIKLRERAPRDSPGGARWQSARYDFGPSSLQPGLRFLAAPSAPRETVAPVLSGVVENRPTFDWMPRNSESPAEDSA
jgi:hypothetical protein